MFYSDYYLKRSLKIPTFLSLMIVGILTVLMSRYLSMSTPIQAAKQPVKKIVVSNVSAEQVAIFWQSNQNEPGFILYGTDKNSLDKSAFDVREETKASAVRANHYVVLKDLVENTPYYFKPSNGKEVYVTKQKEPYHFNTTRKSQTVNSLKPAYGKVVSKNSRALANAIVILTVKGAHPLSSISKITGEWLVPLNGIIDVQTGLLTVPTANDPVQIDVYSEAAEQSNIKVPIDKVSPIAETITIGKNYDFTQKTEVLAAQTSASPKKSNLISFPESNAKIPSSEPLIKGLSSVGSVITAQLTGKSTFLTKTITVGADKTWKWTLTQALPPETYTLSINAKDKQGGVTNETRKFSILKTGDQVLGEATPSATLAPSPIAEVATVTITPLTPTPTLPISGNNVSIFAISSISLIVLGLGLLVAF